MIRLHGIYAHGKVEILEHNPPQIRAEVEIVIPETTEPTAEDRAAAMAIVREYKGYVRKWTRDEIHERQDTA